MQKKSLSAAWMLEHSDVKKQGGKWSPGPRKDLEHELKPTERVERETSIKKKAVAGRAFSLSQDSPSTRRDSNLQTHNDGWQLQRPPWKCAAVCHY